MKANIQDYFLSIQSLHNSGNAREHAYRSAFQMLVESLSDEIEVINEPAYTGGNAPDFLFKKSGVPIAYAECKDITVDLNDKKVQSQAQRYVDAFGKILLTNYHEFQIINETGLVSEFSLIDFKDNRFRQYNEDVVASKLLLIKDYLKSTPQTIKSAKRLAEIMAAKGQLLRANALASLTENKKSTIAQQYGAFKEVLIHDLSYEDFADMYAQTLVYGLFVARYFDESLHNFSRYEAHDLLPSTNPLLKKFFGHVAGTDYDNKIAWMVDSLIEAYLATDVKKIMHQEFEKKKKDPVLHFYETFLAEYDQKLRASRGVYYTPEPVVSFMVRSVDQILKDKFNLTDGLAGRNKISHEFATDMEDNRTKDGIKKAKRDIHQVQILDPATGTGTFLNEVIRHIHNDYKNDAGAWNSYVSKHLLPRLHGFELMMASYTMAHMKLGITLREFGYAGNDRLSVWLTNSLEAANDKQRPLEILMSRWLTEEAAEAGRIKSELPIMVVMGNPPYSGVSSNETDFAKELVNKYKIEPGAKQKLQERKHWLNDDYVKFISLAESQIANTGKGIVNYITSHGYLDNPTFRGMRWHLLKTFDEIYVLDLHGNANKKETTPNGGKDENIFDIKTGVSIFFGIKTGEKQDNELGRVFRADLYGKRADKYHQLDTSDWQSMNWEEVHPEGSAYYFHTFDYQAERAYQKFFGVQELFTTNVTGIVTMGDGFAIADTKEEINERLRKVQENKPSEPEFKNEYNLGKNYGKWLLENIDEVDVDKNLIQKVSYRPFDDKYLYYDSKVIWRLRENVMQHFVQKENLALITTRINRQQSLGYFYITKILSDFHVLDSAGDSTSVFPLYLYHNDGTKVPNLDQQIWDDIGKITGDTAPEDILDYIYAVLHSPSYRDKYQEFLKIDFPRVPYPESKELFWELVKKGTELRQLHLLENISRSDYITSYPVSGDAESDNKITRRLTKNSIGFELTDIENKTGRVWINDLQYFDGVPELAWEFYIGGYQPAQKWLKDRRDRTLSFDDIEHYHKIIHALTHTDRIMKEIDEVWDIESE